jgi:transcriptional regulator GlxA family with amidase domain
LISFTVYFIRKYFKRKLLLTEVQLQETEKKLFLLQVEHTVFDMEMPLTVKTLADSLNFSERSLYRSFEEYGVTPGAYLKELRLKKAKHLLKNTDDMDEIMTVAQKVGYTEKYLIKLLEQKDTD